MRIMDSEGPAILRMLQRLLGNRNDAMDAYQECFCKLAARGDGCGVEHAKAYVYRTASNIAVEMIRSRTRRREHMPAVAEVRARQSGEATEADANRAPAGQEDVLHDMRRAISRLPAHLRNVITLRDLCRLSYAEVGKTLGIEPATARVYRRQAVIALSRKLGAGKLGAGEQA
jgi:RNA polymerase sigma-70 factor (ECF subfamily)